MKRMPFLSKWGQRVSLLCGAGHAFFAPYLWAALTPAAPLPNTPLPPGLQPPDVPPQPPDLRDILPPVEIPYWTPQKIALAGFGALVGLWIVVWLLWKFVQWLRRPPALPPLPPREIALKALERLSGPEGLEMDSRSFAAALTEVLRRYLEATYGIQATRQTTAEFLRTIGEHEKFTPEVRDGLFRFLGLCDRLKFAGEHAEAAGRKELITVVEEQVTGGPL